MSDYELDTDLLGLLPPWYREILDYQEICRTEQEQMAALAAEIAAVADDLFFQTMDAGAVSQWEQIFGIIPDPSAETLPFRRARVLNRISSRPPYTMEFLRKKLDELIGPGAWTVTVDYPNYTLYIESSAEDQQYATEVAYTINRIKPAHIVFLNSPYLSGGLLLSEGIGLTQRFWNYRLGAWGLGVSPFADDQDKGAIKMPSARSVQNGLLENTADYISATITQARINGATIISDLSKSVSGSQVTITYTVAPAQAEIITQVELLDAEGAVMTSAAVYVPVETSTNMKHLITVAEGVENLG